MKNPFARPAKTERPEFVAPTAADGKPVPLDGRIAEHCIAKLQNVGGARHMLSDKAGAKMMRAKTRPESLKWQTANQKDRAVGTSAEASLWLFQLMAHGMAERKTPQAVGQPVLSRMLVDALDLVDDRNYEAEIAESYEPQAQRRLPGK